MFLLSLENSTFRSDGFWSKTHIITSIRSVTKSLGKLQDQISIQLINVHIFCRCTLVPSLRINYFIVVFFIFPGLSTEEIVKTHSLNLRRNLTNKILSTSLLYICPTFAQYFLAYEIIIEKIMYQL